MRINASRWREHARALKNEAYALSIAYRDPRTPWYAKAWALVVVAYALSPIDLIPDFIPLLGYLDDLILLPLGVALAIKLIPAGVMEEARLTATLAGGSQIGKIGGVVIALVWILLIGLAIGWIVRFFQNG
ncbi:MAG: DUF1232 domain-containing protein [Chloroflexi bacterium]|nr:MAG: DUF1232 domain-containing protein [Chloroflexota bacterium]